MNNVRYIEININKIGETTEILIDVEKNLLTINNKQKNITKDKISELFRIIRTWKSTYESSNVLDGLKFTIKIITEDTIDTIVNNGSYPDNYIYFNNWLGELYE